MGTHNFGYSDDVYLCYGLQLGDLPMTRKCNGCRKSFSIEHRLSCKTVVLVGARHMIPGMSWCTYAALLLVDLLLVPNHTFLWRWCQSF
jgi:hypothetical protein